MNDICKARLGVSPVSRLGRDRGSLPTPETVERPDLVFIPGMEAEAEPISQLSEEEMGVDSEASATWSPTIRGSVCRICVITGKLVTNLLTCTKIGGGLICGKA